ncbi:MAG: DoxX family membrane protein [Patescibacteria group bacterium]
MFFHLNKNPKLSPVLILRIGLGLTLLYASLHMFFDPVSWVGFIPQWVRQIIDPRTFLYIHSAFEFILSVLLLRGIFLPAVSFIVFLDFTSILLFYGVDDITFRDFGLAMAALALFTSSINSKKE